MKGTLRTELCMAKPHISLIKAISTLESSRMTNFMERALTPGKMVISMMVNGRMASSEAMVL